MAVEVEDQSLSIVVVGAFNPPIFQPAWMSAEGFLRDGDAETAEVEIIHTEATVFHTGWFRCEVLRDRLALRTSQESHYLLLRDLACAIFKSLRHTPTSACGVNHAWIMQFPDLEAYDAFGWSLAPPDMWADVLERPGTARLDEQGIRTDGIEGWVRVKVEPILDRSNRIVLEVNDHFSLLAPDSELPTAAATERLVGTLLEQWDAVSERSEQILGRIKELTR